MPQVIEFTDMPSSREPHIPAPWGLWRRLCDATPEGKALEITDLIPADMTPHRFRANYASGAKRYNCILSIVDGRAFLRRR